MLGVVAAAWAGWSAVGWWEYRRARAAARAVNTRGVCQPSVTPGVRAARRRESQRWAEAAFADPATRSRLEAAVHRTETTEPVPDDFRWLR